jgi:hypothetical protein
MYKKLFDALYFGYTYFFISIILGTFINAIFPKYDKNKSTGIIIIEITLQIMIIVITAYFIKVIAAELPLIYDPLDSLSRNKISLLGDILMSFVFYTTQDHFIAKVNHLQNEIEMLFK